MAFIKNINSEAAPKKLEVVKENLGIAGKKAFVLTVEGFETASSIIGNAFKAVQVKIPQADGNKYFGEQLKQISDEQPIMDKANIGNVVESRVEIDDVSMFF